MYYRLTRGICFYILPDKSINRVKSGNFQMQVNSEILQTLKMLKWISEVPISKRNLALNCKYFLTRQFKHVCVLDAQKNHLIETI